MRPTDSAPNLSSPAALPPRAHGLDTLRAFAIVLVFAYHYQSFVSRHHPFGWAGEIGWVGVDLFFVLSGYLISHQLLNGLARERALDWKTFYLRRAFRTLPNYLAVLALFMAFPAQMGGRTPPPLWRFLSFTQNIGLQPGTAFSHAWSLCIEEQFYLVLPLVIALGLVLRLSVRWAWVAIGLCIASAIAWRSGLWSRYGLESVNPVTGYYPHIYYSTLCRFDEFLPGVAVALLRHAHPALWERLMARGHVLLVAGLAATALCFWALLRGYYIDGYGYGHAMTAFGYSAMAGCFALLVMAALSPHSLLFRWQVPGAARLAAWSYAIYLTHKSVMAMLKQPLSQSPGLVGWMPLLITLASLLAGWLLYRVVERPFMAWRERWAPARAATRGPSVSGAQPAA